MKWAEFKQMNVGQHIDFAQALAKASSIEDGAAQSGVLWNDAPIEDVAREMFLDFLDAATPFEGAIEMIADAAIAAIDNGTDWVDAALKLVRFAVPVLEAKPLAGLPF